MSTEEGDHKLQVVDLEDLKHEDRRRRKRDDGQTRRWELEPSDDEDCQYDERTVTPHLDVALSHLQTKRNRPVGTQVALVLNVFEYVVVAAIRTNQKIELRTSSLPRERDPRDIRRGSLIWVKNVLACVDGKEVQWWAYRGPIFGKAVGQLAYGDRPKLLAKVSRWDSILDVGSAAVPLLNMSVKVARPDDAVDPRDDEDGTETDEASGGEEPRLREWADLEEGDVFAFVPYFGRYGTLRTVDDVQPADVEMRARDYSQETGPAVSTEDLAQGFDFIGPEVLACLQRRMSVVGDLSLGPSLSSLRYTGGERFYAKCRGAMTGQSVPCMRDLILAAVAEEQVKVDDDMEGSSKDFGMQASLKAER